MYILCVVERDQLDRNPCISERMIDTGQTDPELIMTHEIVIRANVFSILALILQISSITRYTG